MAGRVRELVGNLESSCSLCGHAGLLLERSRSRRTGIDWLNPRWNPKATVYETCPSCHARVRHEVAERG